MKFFLLCHAEMRPRNWDGSQFMFICYYKTSELQFIIHYNSVNLTLCKSSFLSVGAQKWPFKVLIVKTGFLYPI